MRHTQKKCVQGVGPGGRGGESGFSCAQCEGAPLINAWLKTAISFHPLWYIKGCRLVRSGLMNIRADIGPLGGWGARRPPAAHTCTCSVIKSAGPTLPCHNTLCALWAVASVSMGFRVWKWRRAPRETPTHALRAQLLKALRAAFWLSGWLAAFPAALWFLLLAWSFCQCVSCETVRTDVCA
jgi:hypothetical protein